MNKNKKYTKNFDNLILGWHDLVHGPSMKINDPLKSFGQISI